MVHKRGDCGKRVVEFLLQLGHTLHATATCYRGATNWVPHSKQAKDKVSTASGDRRKRAQTKLLREKNNDRGHRYFVLLVLDALSTFCLGLLLRTYSTRGRLEHHMGLASAMVQARTSLRPLLLRCQPRERVFDDVPSRAVRSSQLLHFRLILQLNRDQLLLELLSGQLALLRRDTNNKTVSASKAQSHCTITMPSKHAPYR